MRHFRPPIHAAVVAATLVAGLASYQGVDKLVLAQGGHQYGTANEPGHETASTTSSTLHHEPASTTSTTVHREPGPTASTSSTIPHEPGSTTSTTAKHEPGPTTPTTVHHETGSSTSTTVHREPTPSTTAPKPLQILSLKCGTAVLADGRGAASCGWSESAAPNFHLYRLTRELVGTPRQTIFTTEDRGKHTWGDIGLTPGSEYSYIIEAYDADGHLIGRGGPVHVTCCNGAVVTA